ncbi:hypothetical protein CBR_g51558 [Chara braunii]|uniref:Uncharacterized protein n=1 Tax=Chara braunii TaxID=69332 RepID=A0A388M8P6_CHABU|nr:hypothetical protein CBR_g51558 [Chara braunii]|eukprot:GBG90954.1 hypothetical protein CBR_g51558 [Chara braunii]
MKEMHRVAGREAEVLKGKRVVAEGEVIKLKEQFNKLPSEESVKRREGGGTNLKTRLEAVANRSGRKGLKVSPRRDVGGSAEASGNVNERFHFIEAQKKDLINYKKSGLEMIYHEAGLKLRAVDLIIVDIAEYRADKALGKETNGSKDNVSDEPVHEVSDDSPADEEASVSEDGRSVEL